METSFDRAAQEIIRAGKRLDQLGLAPATSGNCSMRMDDQQIAVTVSGYFKGDLQKDQIMRVSLDGAPLEEKTPSAETGLHVMLYELFPHIKAVLHTHSVPCVVLTRAKPHDKEMVIEQYELLKAFPEIHTHDKRMALPVFDNSQDIEQLSHDAGEVLRQKPNVPAFLIRGHGLYGWGKTMKEAMQVVEALEVMLTCEMEFKKLMTDKG